jgi:hypothetical protein
MSLEDALDITQELDSFRAIPMAIINGENCLFNYLREFKVQP